VHRRAGRGPGSSSCRSGIAMSRTTPRCTRSASSTARATRATRQCSGRRRRSAPAPRSRSTSGSRSIRARLDATYLWPAEDDWSHGDHDVVCAAVTTDGRPLTRSMAAGSEPARQRDGAQHLVQFVEGPSGAAPRRPELGEDALDANPLGHQLPARVEHPLDLATRRATPTSPATASSPRARAAGGRPLVHPSSTRATNACSSRWWIARADHARPVGRSAADPRPALARWSVWSASVFRADQQRRIPMSGCTAARQSGKAVPPLIFLNVWRCSSVPRGAQPGASDVPAPTPGGARPATHGVS
jgi:hypothetical protein